MWPDTQCIRCTTHSHPDVLPDLSFERISGVPRRCRATREQVYFRSGSPRGPPSAPDPSHPCGTGFRNRRLYSRSTDPGPRSPSPIVAEVRCAEACRALAEIGHRMAPLAEITKLQRRERVGSFHLSTHRTTVSIGVFFSGSHLT